MDILQLLVIVLPLQIAGGIFIGGRPVTPAKPVKVQTKIGEIIGYLETITFDGDTYNVQEFLGIPYAEAPVGNNRFRKPIPKAPFTTPFSAFHYGASCHQRILSSMKKFPMAEDCLFLNIFVPVISNPSQSKIPVMIWIHGGGFERGSSTLYPGENLSAFGEVIVVTLNYRLAHMGFLRTNESAANFGLWDQHLAIKWVNDNIGSFGGDVNNITIFGESAGSSSVVYQVLFPDNKGLFQRAIAESGGITSAWAFSTNEHADGIFKNFTLEIGCSTGTHDIIMACLRNKTTVEIANIMNSRTLNYSNVIPNRDTDFIPEHPQDMINPLKAAKASLEVFQNVDFMMGSCSIDGALYLPYFAPAVNVTDLDKFKVPRDMYEKYFVPGVLSSIFTNIHPIPKDADTAAVFQYTNWTDPNDYMARNFELVDLLTDSSMFVPMVAMAQLHTRSLLHSTYVYEFSTAPTTHWLPVPNWLEGPTNAIHGDDFFFVFGFPPLMLKWLSTDTRPLNYTEKDIKASKVVMAMWTNFAKTGNPNQPYSIPATWPQYDMTSQTYMDITPTITPESVKQHIAAKRMAFWLELLPKLLKPTH